MAGHGYVKHDAAIERWSRMREDVYKNFRFTRRTAWQSFCGMLLIPGALLWLSSKQDTKWVWAGKTKGESLARVPPTTESSD